MRESPSVLLMERLEALGAHIDYSDPYFPSFPEMREHSFTLDSVALTPETIAGFYCVLVATEHDGSDYDLILDNASLEVDTRTRYSPSPQIVNNDKTARDGPNGI